MRLAEEERAAREAARFKASKVDTHVCEGARVVVVVEGGGIGGSNQRASVEAGCEQCWHPILSCTLPQKLMHNPPKMPRKAPPPPVTAALAPRLSTIARAEHHNTVIEPSRRARLNAAEREALVSRGGCGLPWQYIASAVVSWMQWSHLSALPHPHPHLHPH